MSLGVDDLVEGDLVRYNSVISRVEKGWDHLDNQTTSYLGIDGESRPHNDRATLEPLFEVNSKEIASAIIAIAEQTQKLVRALSVIGREDF